MTENCRESLERHLLILKETQERIIRLEAECRGLTASSRSLKDSIRREAVEIVLGIIPFWYSLKEPIGLEISYKGKENGFYGLVSIGDDGTLFFVEYMPSGWSKSVRAESRYDVILDHVSVLSDGNVPKLQSLKNMLARCRFDEDKMRMIRNVKKKSKA